VLWLIGGIFALLWLYLLQLRKDLLGSILPKAPATRGDDGAPEEPGR